MRERRRREDILTDVPLMAAWPAPQADSIARAGELGYETNKRAVEMWAEGKPERDIFRVTRLTAREARTLVLRCTRHNRSTGQIFGFWACLPGFRSAPESWERSSQLNLTLAGEGKGMTGVLQQLFRRHPAIQKGMEAFARKREITPGHAVNAVSPKKIHEQFLRLCKMAGVPQTEWPYVAKRRGYGAITEWYKKKRYEHPARTADNEYGSDEGKLVRSDYAALLRDYPVHKRLAYERVELDEHYMDAMWQIGFPTSSQHIEHITARRLWALVSIETRSNAVLSSCLAYGVRYTRNDVLRLIRNAVKPPQRMTLSLRDIDFQYAEDAAYPGELPEFESNTWQNLAADNDGAHVSPVTWAEVEKVIGCHVLHERVGDSQARPHIESFFKKLAEAASWLPSATGNAPESPFRREPEIAARRYPILAHLAEELLDVTCRNYNVTPNTGCGGLTPLSVLKELLHKGEVFRCPAGTFSENHIWRLLPQYAARLNRARRKSGLGPLYVELFGARYSSADLANDQQLGLAKSWDVTVYVEEDARFAYIVPHAMPARVFPVAICGRYSDMPHTLPWRRAHEAFARTQRMAGRTLLPNSMLGFAYGLAKVANADDKAATLLAGMISFMNRQPLGEAPLTGMDHGEATRLLESVAQAEQWLEDDESVPLPSQLGGPRPRGGIIFGE